MHDKMGLHIRNQPYEKIVLYLVIRIRHCIVRKFALKFWMNDESTPLSFAAFYNKGPEIVKCLIENGADIGAKDIYQQTPLHLAIAKFENCSSEMIKKYLIINGRVLV